jgi:acetyltransferase-like isoleucine patch superfamily enzyme
MKNYILRYIKQPSLFFSDRKKKVRLSLFANAQDCHFEGKNKIYPRAHVCRSSLGRGSYIGPNSRMPRCKIGRYCSIGPEVLVLSGTHPIDEKISTHPCFYSLGKQAGFTYVRDQSYDEFLLCRPDNQYYVEIGSDVWIGARVIIVGGVRIGHGAVVAAGSVVTKDVPDYAIVGGVPAKQLRFRFSENLRTNLLEERWWEQEEDWILDNLHRFSEVV